jgi:hypothetical protein
VYDILLFIPEGICFAVFVAFVACCYIMQFLICVCFCCVSVNFHILVCVFGFLAFPCCEHRQKKARPSTIKLHADGNLTSKVIESCVVQTKDRNQLAIILPNHDNDSEVCVCVCAISDVYIVFGANFVLM